MASLRTFFIGGNALKGFKPTVLQGPTSAILAALRHRLAEVKAYNPSKQLILFKAF
jgi:hypothetical protein